MKISLNWLREYIDITLPPTQIAKMLTSAGLEVDGILPVGLNFKKVVVGHVVSAQKHPNADNLSVAQVTDGTETYQIVCGAPNCREGLKTALALVGAILYDASGKEFKIKQTKLRGVESCGMLCSGLELGLSDEHVGIIEFSDQIPIGADVASLYADTVFEISLTPNLAHCHSVLGISRELSTLTGLPIRYPEINVKKTLDEHIQERVKVQVKNQVKCPRYACRLIKDVDVKSSPEWLKKKLELSGFRSINTVVDVTNYVLLELGHPMHAFDFDKLQGGQILVKEAQEGEVFETLDEKERTLNSTDLVICDQKQVIAIAGVMGGRNSEVGLGTKNILLEAAYFQPSTIRRTSKRLGISTESSKRFERGCDPNAVLLALDRAATLIQELSGGTIVQGIVDVKEKDIPEAILSCRLNRLNMILGTHLSVDEVETIFRRLHFTPKWNGQEAFSVKVPTYRVDVTAEIDLIEEVARVYGYDNIPKTVARYSATHLPHSSIYLFEREVRAHLLSEGLQEFLTCDLIGPTLINIVQDHTVLEETQIKVLNPTSIEQSVLRTSLLPGLLGVIKYNHDHQNPHISGFELGRVHFKKGEQYQEQTVIGIILAGKSQPHHWDKKPDEVDFYDLKGILENLLQELRIPSVKCVEKACPVFHTGRQAALYVDSLEIGSFGEIHPAIQRRLDVPQRIYFAELNLHDLIQIRLPEQKMTPLPIYPCSERDWTVTLQEGISVEKVMEILRLAKSSLLEKVFLLDLYHSEKLGLDKKNATFRFIYRDATKTVEQETVEKEHHRMITDIMSKIEGWT